MTFEQIADRTLRSKSASPVKPDPPNSGNVASYCSTRRGLSVVPRYAQHGHSQACVGPFLIFYASVKINGNHATSFMVRDYESLLFLKNDRPHVILHRTIRSRTDDPLKR